ncbi:MAG: hypothetical protein AAGJ40_09440 [Planctomycetota bacterium]
MITRAHLASRWRSLPADVINQVTMYERHEDSVYRPAEPMTVSAAAKRPLSKDEKSVFDNVKVNSERRSWHIWVETITAPWDTSFDPYSVEIVPDWIVKESNGDEWVVVAADLGLLDTHWRCPCYLRWGAPLIP